MWMELLIGEVDVDTTTVVLGMITDEEHGTVTDVLNS